jgi:hypothetical protein
VKQVVVRVCERPIPKELLGGDYEGDPAFRARMQTFVQDMWTEKDARIEEIVLSLRSQATAS